MSKTTNKHTPTTMLYPMARHVDRRYKNKVARERKRLEDNPALAVCWLCGEPINMQLPDRHARAFTLDHVVPVSRGGSLHGETKPAHRCCNSSRGNIHKKQKAIKPLLKW